MNTNAIILMGIPVTIYAVAEITDCNSFDSYKTDLIKTIAGISTIPIALYFVKNAIDAIKVMF